MDSRTTVGSTQAYKTLDQLATDGPSAESIPPMGVIHQRVAAIANRVDGSIELMLSQIDGLHGAINRLSGAQPERAEAGNGKTEPRDHRQSFAGAIGAVDEEIMRAEQLMDRLQYLLMSGFQSALDRIAQLS